MPDGNNYIRLKKLIFEISNSFEGIKFSPHVTLLSGFTGNEKKIINKTLNLSKKIKPFFLELDEIDFRNEFFRTFYFKVNFDRKFKKARSMACSEFSWNDEGFIPHLSLAYGLIDPVLKKNLKNNIRNNIKEFLISDIFLAHNDEKNYKWKIIKKFPLLI